jgi:hypothetical protein
MTDKAKPPPGLSAGGRRFWREIQSAYELRPDELVILEKAARTLDDLGRLEAALASSAVLVAGSMGQERPNPLFGECRSARTVLAALLKQLAIPDPAAEKIQALARSANATKAARARWTTSATQPRRSA